MQNDCTVKVFKSDGTTPYPLPLNGASDSVSVGTNTGDVTLTKASYAYTDAHKIKTTCNGVDGAIIEVKA